MPRPQREDGYLVVNQQVVGNVLLSFARDGEAKMGVAVDSN
jgi:hypothetical protein